MLFLSKWQQKVCYLPSTKPEIFTWLLCARDSIAFLGCLFEIIEDFSVGYKGQEAELCSICLNIINMVVGLCVLSKMNPVTSGFGKYAAT